MLGILGFLNTHCYTHSGVAVSNFHPRHHFEIVCSMSDSEIVMSLVVVAWESRAWWEPYPVPYPGSHRTLASAYPGTWKPARLWASVVQGPLVPTSPKITFQSKLNCHNFEANFFGHFCMICFLILSSDCKNIQNYSKIIQIRIKFDIVKVMKYHCFIPWKH